MSFFNEFSKGAHKIAALAVILIGATVLLSACSGGSASAPPAPAQLQFNNPAPSISSVSPPKVVVGSAGVTLTVTGSNLINTTVVKWNGTNLTTTFVSSTQLTADVPASLLTATATVQIQVFNPAPGGGNSGALTFAIENGVPTIATLSPASLSAGGAPFTLVVDGSLFVSGATIQWNGATLPTTFVSSSQVTAMIPSALIQTTGTAQIAVVNPAPGGGSSGTAALSIDATMPKFAYVAHMSKNAISMYVVDASTGELRHNGYVMAGADPCFVITDMSAKFAYAVNYSSNNISAYRIESSGRLTEIAGSPFPVGTGPWGVAVDPTNNFLLVTNWDSNNASVLQIDHTTGALSPVAGSPVATGTWPEGPAFDPTGKFAFVANYGSDNVSVYGFDAATGALAPVPNSPFAVSAYPVAVVPDSSGKFIHVLSSDAAGVISTFGIDSVTGVLTPAGSPAAAGAYPVAMIRTKDDRFAYVLNYASKDLSGYSISSADGSLTPISGTPLAFPATTLPSSAAIDSQGKFLYVSSYQMGKTVLHVYAIDASTGALTLSSNTDTMDRGIGIALVEGPSAASVASGYVFATDNSTNNVTAFKADANNGALTAVGGAATELNPKSVAVHHSGKFIYVANSGSNTISGFSVDASTGALSAIGAATPAGTNPQALVIEPSGRFLYAVNSGSSNVSVYAIDPSTGGLSAIGNVAAGQTPIGIVMDPTVRWAYVPAVGSARVDRYSIDLATGMLINRVTLPTPISSPALMTVDPKARATYTIRHTELDSGQLYMPDGSTFGTGIVYLPAPSATAMATDPDGRFLYVAVAGSNSVEAFTLDAITGLATLIGSISSPNPAALMVDPCGRYLYVASTGSTQISVFSINSSSGLLTANGTAPAGAATAQSAPTGATTALVVSSKVQ